VQLPVSSLLGCTATKSLLSASRTLPGLYQSPNNAVEFRGCVTDIYAPNIHRFLAHGPLFVSPESFAKKPFEDLAGTVFRQFGD
jgi:hypothetical protein